MSSDDDTPGLPALRSELEALLWGTYCAIASTTLLAYDHLATFSEERRLLWSRKFTGSTALYVLIRYGTLSLQILTVLDVFPWKNQTDKSCIAPIVIQTMFIMLVYCVTTAFSVLRIYAIWAKHWLPTSIVLVIAIVFPCANIYYYAHTVPSALSPPLSGGCGVEVTISSIAAFERLSFVAHSSALATDCVVIILTWMKTYGISRTAMQLNIKAGLSTLLLRDGTVYFLILMFINILQLVLLKTTVLFNPIPPFYDVFNAILISRFILSLRQVFLPDSGNRSESSVVSSVRFASNIVGNLGAPLSHGENGSNSVSGDSLDWDVEDDLEHPQVSHDPLAAGLLTEDGEVQGTELRTIQSGSV